MKKKRRESKAASMAAACLLAAAVIWFIVLLFMTTRKPTALVLLGKGSVDALITMFRQLTKKAFLAAFLAGAGAFCLMFVLRRLLLGRRRRRAAGYILNGLLFVSVLVTVLWTGKEVWQVKKDDAQIQSVRELIRDSGRIIHAGGNIIDAQGNLQPYTNSIEAVENAIENGERIIEIDIRMTTDDELVCMHAGTYVLDENGVPYEDSDISLKEFLKGTTMGGMTVMTFQDLAAFVREYEDLYIVLDAKKRRISCYSQIAETYPDIMDRLIPQIYHLNLFDKVWDLGYRNIIYTLYHADPEEYAEDVMAQFLKTRTLMGITFPEYRREEGILDVLKTTELPLYTHTLDDPAQIREAYETGIEAVYTNVVNGI